MNTKKICITALGIALYVVVSMMLKIPLGIAHISIDLGYIVLAVYCYSYGPMCGAIVGGAGCAIVSILASGMFPPGWMLGNICIGAVCGALYRHNEGWRTITYNIIITVIMIAVGIEGIKTVVECLMFSIPFSVKLASNGVASIADSISMCIGVLLAGRIDKLINR